MSFDYNKTKQSHNADSFWTSYSDLFLGLSTIFLLLYVTASLRTGTDAIKAQVSNQKLTMQVEELQSQLKMYESVKTDYMEKEASQNEQQEYMELMDKLTLLQEDAKDERERLARESLESDKKAAALNKYQQMVRNVMNANKLAKTKLLARKDFIAEQDTTIGEQKKDITDLKSDVVQKESEIADNQREIADAKSQLAANKQKLLKAYKANQITKQAFEQKTRALQAASDAKISGLSGALAEKGKEVEGMKGKMAAMRAGFEAEVAQGRAALDAEIKKGQMDAAERARREGEFRAAMAGKEKALNQRIAGLQGQLKDTEGALSKAKEEIDARREIAREIQKGFAAAGIKAGVDMGTGEVVLDFGDHYFDSDSAHLKNEMRAIIERAMPVYSKSLFGNPKVAQKISAVEVIGFASPTYKGRFVDPHSSSPEDRAALKYNMDLSYRRANSIFNYLVEGRGAEFAYEKPLLALMKVSGRSFLDVMRVQNRGPATAAEFCKANDCKKAQRVIVRFSMDGKK
ncbi:MAG TPA: microtubule-binding protein [Bdellovibrionales bacterium]|mgnify:CR=1 FL=1|nr:microtubule-binding protein [Bdellovibrionales bacterium]